MSYYGMVTEDPTYDEDGVMIDEDADWDDINELEDPTDFIAALEIYHPSNTINS
jgi:hypothetical protein